MKSTSRKIMAWAVFIYLIAMITLHRYPSLPDNEISFGDFANIMIGLVAIATLIFSLVERYNENKIRESSVALESFVTRVDSTINVLSQAELPHDRKWLFIQSAYEGLKSTENYITREEHQRLASAKFEELRVHLKLLYHNLRLDSFIDVPNDVEKDFYNYDHSVSTCMYLITISWLRYVVKKTYHFRQTGVARFGNEKCTDLKFIYPLLSLLASKPLNLVSVGAMEDKFTEFGQSLVNDSGEIDEYIWKYPRLVGYIMLTKTLSVKNLEKGVYYPIPMLKCVANPMTDKRCWFASELNQYYQLPDILSHPRYLYLIGV